LKIFWVILSNHFYGKGVNCFNMSEADKQSS